MNENQRVIGLRKLIKEKYQENIEYSKILSQFESYRIKFLEDIENQMQPAHSIFSTDSDSDSYDEENSESSSDSSYCIPPPRKINRATTPDLPVSLNFEKNNINQNKKNEIASLSSPQLFQQLQKLNKQLPIQKLQQAPIMQTPQILPQPHIPQQSQPPQPQQPQPQQLPMQRSLSQQPKTPPPLPPLLPPKTPTQPSPLQQQPQPHQPQPQQQQSQQKQQMQQPQKVQNQVQLQLQNQTSIIQFNNLIQKLFPNNYSALLQYNSKKVQIQNQNSSSSSTNSISIPQASFERSKSAPTPKPIHTEIVNNDPIITKETKHFLFPSNITISKPPPRYEGSIPGHVILNSDQNIYANPNKSNDLHKTFYVNDGKVADLILQYRRNLELLQQQIFVNSLLQLSSTQTITIDLVEKTYRLIQQNVLNCNSYTLRDKLEMTDLDQATEHILNKIIKNTDDNGTGLYHMDLLKSKVSLWAKVSNQKTDQFLFHIPEIIKPNETVKMIDSIDVKSLNFDPEINLDFKFTYEPDSIIHMNYK